MHQVVSNLEPMASAENGSGGPLSAYPRDDTSLLVTRDDRRLAPSPQEAAPSRPMDAVQPPTTAAAADLGAPPRTVRDGWFWLACAGLGFVVGQLLSAVLLAAVAAVNGHGRDLSALLGRAVPPAWVVVCGLVGLWLGFLGAVVTASRRRGTGHVLADMRWGFRRWDPVIGVVTGLLGQFVLLPLLYVPMQFLVPNLSQKLSAPAKHLTGGFPGADVAAIAFLTVVVVPIVEELMFRGLVLRGFLRVFARAGRAIGPTLAIVATGVVFGFAHLEALQFVGLLAFGAVLALLAYKFDRLGPSIFAHGTFNLIAILTVVYSASAHPGIV
jgi:CAAX protease family protein